MGRLCFIRDLRLQFEITKEINIYNMEMITFLGSK